MSENKNNSIERLFKSTELIDVLGMDLGFHDIEINFNTITLYVSNITLKKVKEDLNDYMENTEYVLNNYKNGYSSELDGHLLVIRFAAYTYVFVDMFKKEIYKQIKP